MLQFVREVPVRIVIKETSSERRGFLFYVSAGFVKEINPLTGMSVNLPLIDQWLTELKAFLEHKYFEFKHESLNQVCAEILASARLNLFHNAQSDGVQLVSLQFREHRGWAFSWQSPQSLEEFTIKHVHYYEAFVEDLSKFELFKIELQWRRVVGCEFDFFCLGEDMVKNLKAKDIEELCGELSKHKGYKVNGGSFLEAVVVNSLSRSFEVSV